MLCYKDRTFRPFYLECAEGDKCPRAFTPQIRRDAGSFGMGVMEFMEKPEWCFKERRK